MNLEEFAQHVLQERREYLAKMYSQRQADAEQVEVIPGRVYTKIDRGSPFNNDEHPGQGYLMIETATGNIYGIKAYGKVHKGHAYGTLETVHDWYWGDFYPRRKP
jgi:hypothetical protein